MQSTALVLEADSGKWDQAVLNQQLFTLSHGEYRSSGCSVRVMEREKFMNSKVRHFLLNSWKAYKADRLSPKHVACDVDRSTHAAFFKGDHACLRKRKLHIGTVMPPMP